MKLLSILLFTTLLTAQDRISVGGFHDIKLGLGMDKQHGNYKPTLDLLLNVSLEGKQFKYYYFSIVPFFETANLKDENFKRYGVSLMWNFNRLVIDKLEIGIGAGFGVIHRPDSHASYSFTGDLRHSFSKTISVALKNEFVQRSDLKTPKFGYNLSLGIKLKLIKL